MQSILSVMTPTSTETCRRIAVVLVAGARTRLNAVCRSVDISLDGAVVDDGAVEAVRRQRRPVGALR